MVLAIDIGNTNIVIGCFQDDKILFRERLSTNQLSTSMEYTVILKNIFELNGISEMNFEGGIISSVVPSVTLTVREAMERLTKKHIMIVGPGIKTGLKIMLDNPAQLGSDRVADGVAAINLYPVPSILIDMGTATTISVINSKREFIGGLIIPGLRTSLDSLANKTSQLPNISLVPPKKVIGANTIDCMRSGIINSTASSIDGIIEKIEDELGEKCTVISTGGIAKIIIPYCKRDIIIDDDLLLKGLMIIYNKNL